MKTIQAFALSLLISFVGTPAPVSAERMPEVFALPDGVVGVTYQANIAAVLREKYQLKLETDVSKPVFRWSFVGGEMPLGLAVRPSGTIVGTPRMPRDEPYRFQVKVIDLAYAGSEALTMDLSLNITAHRIRLTQVRMPRLTPTIPVAIDTHHQVSDLAAARNPEKIRSEPSGLVDVQPPSLDPPSAISVVESDTQVRPPLSLSQPLRNANSSTSIADVSYDPQMVKSVLHRMNIKPPAPLPALPSGEKDYEVDVSKETSSADKIRGPAEITLKNLNVLRYDIRVGKDVRFPPAPNLTLPFIPPIPNQPQQDTEKKSGRDFTRRLVGTIDDNFNALLLRLSDIETDKAEGVNAKIVAAIRDTNNARNRIEALVTVSDSILTTGGGPEAIIVGIKPLITLDGKEGAIDAALNHAWPDETIEDLLGRIESLRTDLLTLPTIHVTTGQTWDEWYKGSNKAAYDYAVGRVGELHNQLNGLKSNGTQGTAFHDAQNKLRRWRPILVGVHDGKLEGFTRKFEVGCGFAFDTGKETKVKLIKRDRLAEPGAALVEEEIVTVVCSSPLSVSAGFGFSNINESEFIFVPSTKTVTENGQSTQTVINRFGFRNKSAFRTLPVLLLNTRVWEPNDTFALHVSTGAAVDVKTGQGGTDLEYIVGPSISFWRSLFVTPGLHIGRVNKLAGGFEVDQEVPNGISEPPIEKSWKRAFVTTFTYKIR